MDEGDVAVALATVLRQTLPGQYLEFLDGLKALPTLGEGYGPILDYGGRHWRPYTRDRLAEIIPHRRREAAFPYAHETARHADSLRTADAAHGGDASAVLYEQGFTLDRLARGFCFGHENGDPLFVDAETGWVYVYYHDGMDVEQVAESLAELIAGSRDWLGDEDEEEL